MTVSSTSVSAIPDWLPVGLPNNQQSADTPRLETVRDYLDYFESQGISLVLLGRGRPWMSARTRELAAKLPVSLCHYFFPCLSSPARLRREPELLARFKRIGLWPVGEAKPDSPAAQTALTGTDGWPGT